MDYGKLRSRNQMIKQGYVDKNLNVTNAAKVKQYLALPCYNMAQTVFQGQVTAPTTGITSQINSASELFNLGTDYLSARRLHEISARQ